MEQDFIAQTALDQMVGSDRTQLLKAAVPYLPPKGQQFVSMYTKLTELAGAIRLFGRSSSGGMMQAASLPARDPLAMLADIRRFCYGNSRKQLDQMVELFSMLQLFAAMGEDALTQPPCPAEAKKGEGADSQKDPQWKEDLAYGTGLETEPQAGRDE